MKCPRCEVDLVLTTTRAHMIVPDAHQCPQCKGHWIDADVKERIESEEVSVLVELRKIPTAEAQQEPLSCPECDEGIVMDKVGTFRDKKVVLDVCPECHKFWLDGGEMRAIQEDSLAALLWEMVRWRERQA